MHSRMHNGVATRKCRWDPEECCHIQGAVRVRDHTTRERAGSVLKSPTFKYAVSFFCLIESNLNTLYSIYNFIILYYLAPELVGLFFIIFIFLLNFLFLPCIVFLILFSFLSSLLAPSASLKQWFGMLCQAIRRSLFL